MLTRRQFLKSGCALTAASGTAALFGDAQAKVSAGAPQYRALVCIAFGGGADSFNMLVPTDAQTYQNYAKRRDGLALNRNELLPLHRGDSKGRSYALHYGLRVGITVQPITGFALDGQAESLTCWGIPVGRTNYQQISRCLAGM